MPRMAAPDPHRIITITGDLGSGKSHVCRLLAERLGFRIVSTGGIQREIAREMNLSTLELNKLSERLPDIDKRIDSHIIALADSTDLICDSRLAWHFLPQSFKVCLKVTPEVAAGRVLRDSKRSGESYASIAEAARALKARRESEVLRFKQLYGADCDRLENYDIVIDTSAIPPEEVAGRIIQGFQGNQPPAC